MLSVTVLTLWVAPPEMFYSWYRNRAETNCGIAHIVGILLMNSCNTVIFLATTIIYSLSTLNTLTPLLRSPFGQRRGSRSSPSAALAKRIAALRMRMLCGHHRTHGHDRVIRAICQASAAISAL